MSSSSSSSSGASTSSSASTSSVNSGTSAASLTPAKDILPETTIAIPDGQTLVLGENGKFLLRNDGGSADPIPDSEWNTPSGYYNTDTQVTASGNTAYLRSVLASSIGKVTASELVVVSGSEITIQSKDSVGLEAATLTVGSQNIDTITKLTVTASDTGIHYTQQCIFEKNAVIDVTGNLFGIHYEGPATKPQEHNLQVFSGAQVTATAATGVAVAVDLLEMTGATLTANAPNGNGGVSVSQDINLSPDGDKRSVLSATSLTGRAITCDFLILNGSDITGVSAQGEIGIHANRSIATIGNQQSTIRGQAYSGYGVVGLDLSGEEGDFPSGTISINSKNGCILEGTVTDGAGIYTRTFTTYSADSDNQLKITGTAEKGIGILAYYFAIGPDCKNIELTGISNGATTTHFQKKDTIPKSAGISTTSLSVNTSGKITATAPKNVPGSCGLHLFEKDESGFISGDLSLSSSEGSPLSVDAKGEIGIFASNFLPLGGTDIHAEGALHGIEVLYFNVYTSDGMQQITAKGDTGCGIYMNSSYPDRMSTLHLVKTSLTAEGAEYGIYAVVDEYVYVTDQSTIVAQATGAAGKTGFFIALREPQKNQLFEIENSNIIANGPLYGLDMQNLCLSVSAAYYTLDLPGQITGTGGESGIRIEPTPSSYYVFPALQTKNMKLPDGSYYTITGISTTVAPDTAGRKGAISLPDSEIDGGAVIVEEYTLPAKESLGSTPYPVYAMGMNIDDYTQYQWTSPDLQLEAHKEGLTATGGALNASITGERATPDTDATIHLVEGTHRVQLTASANLAKVTFNANGGEPAPDDQTVPIGGLVQQPAPMVKPGFTFLGWFETASGSPWDFTVNTVQNQLLQLEAHWQADTFTLTFQGNAEGDPSLSGMPKDNPLHLSVGTLIPKPSETPTRTGMGFQFWADTPTGSTPWNFEDAPMPAKDMDLYAIWQAQQYTVLYDSMGGQPAVQKEEVAYQDRIPGKIQTPTRENHQFAGWFLDKEATQPWDNTIPMPAHDLTLYAKWNRVSATLSFDANGGEASSVPASKNIAPGETVNIADYQPGGSYAPYYTGYFFLGWLDPAGNAVPDTFEMPASNLVLKAQWRKAPVFPLPEQLVLYRNTENKTEVEDTLRYIYQYTDILGREQQLMPHYQWNPDALTSGGVTNITIDFWKGDSRTSGLHTIVKLYVLNPAVLQVGIDTVTFGFGASISRDGIEWSPSSVEEVPDFASGTIQQKKLPILFRLNGTDTRTQGSYHPQFEVTYTDYFGTVHKLKQEVTAIVLGKNVPVSSPSSVSSQSSQVSSSSPASHSASSYPSSAASASGFFTQSEINEETQQKLEQEGDPIFQYGNKKIPLFGLDQKDVWALANLLLLLLSLAGGIFLATYAKKRRLFQWRKEQKPANTTFVLCLLSLFIPPILLFVFLVTQNFNNLMVVIDRYTLFMLLGLLGQLAFAISVFVRIKTNQPGST